MNRIPLLILTALGALTLAGACSREPAAATTPPAETTPPATRPYTIVATVGMVADIAREVGGAHATVTGIIGTGVDPHLYKPTRNDVAALMSADVILYAGHLLEGRMTDTLKQVASRKPVTAVAERIPAEHLLGDEAGTGHPDPHLWMDVRAWMEAVRAVEAALSAYDPEHQPQYQANATRYLAELDALDAYAKRAIASIPDSSRVLITAHDAFHYFGRAYGIEVLGIQGISTESEAGLEDIRRLVALMAERRIGAVFVESSVPDKNVRALIEGARAMGHEARVGGELFSDAMGEAGAYEGTYIGMIDHNVTLITRALGGDAPARGLHGRLAPPHDAPAAEAPHP